MTIPDLKGLLVEDAIDIIQGLKLKPERKRATCTRRGLSNRVYEQGTDPGQTTQPGTYVIIRAYGDYAPIVPDLEGKTVEEANIDLAKSGLHGFGKAGKASS